MSNEFKSLRETHPDLIKEWDFEKNKDLRFKDGTPITPDTVSAGSAQDVWWECSKCHHKWQTPPKSRKRGRGCIVCKNKEARENRNKELLKNNKSFAELRPDLVKQWHPTKNGELKPSEVLPNSNKKVWWVCKRNPKHEWQISVAARYGGRECPYCKRKLVSEENCLATEYPDLIKEWDFEKNEGVTPYDIVANTHKEYWWKCERNHSWKSVVKNRTKHENGCPYCSDRVATEETCLATNYPKLCEEWDCDKNNKLQYKEGQLKAQAPTPQNILPNSTMKVNWICKKCKHEWVATVNSRVGSDSGCPRCNQSKGENFISEYLKSNNIEHKSEYTFNDCKDKRLLPFDFCILSNSKVLGLIEYDGEGHYKPIPRADRTLEEARIELNEIKRRDKIKTSYCKENNIPLLRISYKEFDNMENLLNNFINKIKRT